MLKKIVFYAGIGRKLIKKDVINKEDYRNEYNKVSMTYNRWLDEMGRFTDKIIKPDSIDKNTKLKILDFACGTGYITRKLIEKNIDCEITAVDSSEEMLKRLKSLKDNRVQAIESDGIEFLKTTDQKYDIIYFGWALSYFNYGELFKLFKRVLNPKGTVAIITNTQGTLAGIEDIFMKVMYQNPKEVVKPMDIKFNLPPGKDGLIKWLARYGFQTVEAKEGETIISFDRPEGLLQWLSETGATAGTACIFRDYEAIKDSLIREIRKTKYKDGKYLVNHKFAYGIFELK